MNPRPPAPKAGALPLRYSPEPRLAARGHRTVLRRRTACPHRCRGPVGRLHSPYENRRRAPRGQQGQALGRDRRARVRKGTGRRLPEDREGGANPRVPARQGSSPRPRSPTGQGRGPPGGVEGRPPRLLLPRPAGRGRRRHRRARRSTSPRGRRTARWPSTPSSRSDPTSSWPGYTGLRVEIPSPEVAEEDITSQIDRLRNNFGELTTIARPAKDGDFLTIDLKGTRHGEPVARDEHRRSLLRARQRDRPARAGHRAAGGPGGRHLQVHRRASRRSGHVPGPGQGGQGEGPPRGHRRVGFARPRSSTRWRSCARTWSSASAA